MNQLKQAAFFSSKSSLRFHSNVWFPTHSPQDNVLHIKSSQQHNPYLLHHKVPKRKEQSMNYPNSLRGWTFQTITTSPGNLQARKQGMLWGFYTACLSDLVVALGQSSLRSHQFYTNRYYPFYGFLYRGWGEAWRSQNMFRNINFHRREVDSLPLYSSLHPIPP